MTGQTKRLLWHNEIECTCGFKAETQKETLNHITVGDKKHRINRVAKYRTISLKEYRAIQKDIMRL